MKTTYFYETLFESDAAIMKIESIYVECFADPSVVLINKGSSQLKHLLSLYKAVEKEIE